VLLSPTQRRVAFKLVWGSVLGLDRRPQFVPTLDEQREMYAFYIQHPHPAEPQRTAIARDLASATAPEACAQARTELAQKSALWLAEKLKKLGAMDPTYPTEYALGVVYYQAGRFDQSAESFGSFLHSHPDGAYALLAKNHLKAAVSAHQRF
jgi:hypothetical protein